MREEREREEMVVVTYPYILFTGVEGRREVRGKLPEMADGVNLRQRRP